MFRELNGKDNAKFLLMDAGGREILSLERSVNGKIQKADIFSVPVSFNANEVTHVDTPQEALAASLNKFGEVNLEYMENLGLAGFTQERTSAKEEYTPPFDLEGV